MKTIALSLLALVAVANAADLKFTWDDKLNTPGSVQSYRVYELQGTNRTVVATSTNRTVVVEDVKPGAHTYHVTAFNGIDSDPSPNLSTNLLHAPSGLRVEVVVTVTVTAP